MALSDQPAANRTAGSTLARSDHTCSSSASAQECGLTPRSSRGATAAGLAREAPLSRLRLAGKPAYRSARLSSNVRPRLAAKRHSSSRLAASVSPGQLVPSHGSRSAFFDPCLPPSARLRPPEGALRYGQICSPTVCLSLPCSGAGAPPRTVTVRSSRRSAPRTGRPGKESSA